MPKPKINVRSPVLKVVVTQQHIVDAVRNRSNSCMIGEAIKDQFPKFKHVAVDLQTIRFTDPDKGLRYIYLTPRIAQVALVLFDEGTKMRPINFTLRAAHTVASHVTNRLKGRSVRERVKLGRRRIIPTGHSAPETIGGKAPPRHPSSSGVRRFGMRAFTKEDVTEIKHSN